MAARKAMTDDELKKFLDAEEKDAIGYSWGTLQGERAAAQNFYFARPYGNEVEGRSDLVSTQVFDTIEWALPQLLRIFASTDKAVEFEPQGPEDEAGAKQATDACNYVFWRQNHGLIILYSWFKDALLQKNGIVKWWWSKNTQKMRKKFVGVTVEMVSMLLQKEGAKIIEKSAYPDPMVQQMIQARAMQMAAMGEPMPSEMPTAPEIYDVVIEFTQEAGKVCIAPVPPEEIIVSRRHNSIILDEAPFCEHARQMTLSELRGLGFEFDDDDPEINKDTQAWQDWGEEKIARASKNEDGDISQRVPESTDPSQKMVWVREIYAQVDKDGDGVAEKRRIVMAGSKLMEDELCEHVQMAAITPIIIAHRFFGMSWAEMVMDLQFLCSTIWRQMIDNLFHANNQSHVVLSTPDGRVQANIDDLLDSRPGRVMREYAPGAIRHEETPWVAAQSFPMLEYIDQQRMNRTGTNYLSSGLNADAINKTARGAVLAENKMQEKLELVARIFAEGMKEMFKGVLYMLSKYQSRPLMFRLRNEFVSYDPSDWKTQYDMSINVGLGTGNKDQQMQHLGLILQDQMALLAGPLGQMMVTPQNAYNTRARMVENAGFRNVQEFYTDPKKATLPAQQPQADPTKMAELQLRAKKDDGDLRVSAFNAETQRLKVVHDSQKDAAQFHQSERQQQHGQSMDQRRLAAEQRPGLEMGAMRQESAAATQQTMQGLMMLADQMQQVMTQMQQMMQGIAALANRRTVKIPTRDPKTREIVRVDEVPADQVGAA